MSQLNEKFLAEGIKVIGISADDREDSVEFANDKGISVTLIPDPDLEIIDLYGVRHSGKDISVPVTFVIATDGNIVWTHFGETMMDLPFGETVLEEARSAKEGTP